MTWFTEPNKRWEMICGLLLVLVGCILYERFAIGRHAASIEESAAAINEAVRELKQITISQTQSIQVTPVDEQVKALARDIYQDSKNAAVR